MRNILQAAPRSSASVAPAATWGTGVMTYRSLPGVIEGGCAGTASSWDSTIHPRAVLRTGRVMQSGSAQRWRDER